MQPVFTDTLSAAVKDASEEARRLSQEFVGTEHLLLGILSQKSAQAVHALESATDIKQLRRLLEKALPHAAEPPLVTGRLPLSPRAQRAVNAAISQAQTAGESKVSTRHVLLALLEEPESAVGQAISDCGADLEDLRLQLRRPMNGNEL